METRKAQTEIERPEELAEGINFRRRIFRTETRAKRGDDGSMEVGGYGALFGVYTRLWWFAEVVVPGFFDGIKSDRCACLFNHDPNQVLGREKNGTLAWKVDDKGVDYHATKLPSHRADVYELIEGGYVYESSFGFTIAEEEWIEVSPAELKGKLSDTDIEQLTYGGKVAVRRLIRGEELFDFSPVTFAQYEGTTTDTRYAQRSFEQWKAERGDDLTLLPYKRISRQKEEAEPQQQEVNPAIIPTLQALLAI